MKIIPINQNSYKEQKTNASPAFKAEIVDEQGLRKLYTQTTSFEIIKDTSISKIIDNVKGFKFFKNQHPNISFVLNATKDALFSTHSIIAEYAGVKGESEIVEDAFFYVFDGDKAAVKGITKGIKNAIKDLKGKL